MTMDECGHARLHLMSGGYYLGCPDCHKKWVAITNDGDDKALDHKARFGSLIQPYFDYVLTPIPR
jgi:hypothetical protein